jgi:hypothetical protein
LWEVTGTSHHMEGKATVCQLRYFSVRPCAARGDNKFFRGIAACHAHLETRPDPDRTRMNFSDDSKEWIFSFSTQKNVRHIYFGDLIIYARCEDICLEIRFQVILLISCLQLVFNLPSAFDYIFTRFYQQEFCKTQLLR